MKIATFLVRTSLTFLFLFVSTFIGFSQQADSTRIKPKIGLVLSGGGAKGLAHIGVLKVLEEYGIKPDIITGTSMGSIVGSLYAAGYSAEELAVINQNADWDKLLTDKVPLQKIAMEEKKESNKYLFQIPIKDNKFNLPSGLIEGQNLEDYFSELFWPLTSHENFDSLPIPFHCMSVDLISGNTIEHKSGNLVKSIRASMSIPTVFSPVQMDSMLLVDGGVTRNFPVQQAINMGADIIIGVYVGFEEDVEAEDLSTMTDILQRSIALAGIVDARAQNSNVDILIIPDLSEYGAGDFTKGEAIQQKGEEATREKFNELNNLALSLDVKYEETEKIKKPEKILISAIEIENLQYLSKSFVVNKSGIEKGDSLSHQNIREAIEYMHGTQYFRKLTYSLKKNEEDNYVLVFHVKENPRAMIKIAPHYDDDLGVGLVTNLTLRNVILPSTRLIATVNIAETPGIKLELNKFVGKNQRLSDRFFLNNYNIKSHIYTDGDRLGIYNRQLFDMGYGIQYSPGLNHQIGGNFFYKYGKIKPHADLRLIYPEADFNYYKMKEWGYDFFYRINTTDDLYFPKNGTEFDLTFTHIFSSNVDLNAKTIDNEPGYFVPDVGIPFASLLVTYDWYKTIAQRFTLNFGAGAGVNSDDAGISGYFLLGGSQFGSVPNYIDFAGYNFAEIYSPNIAFLKSGIKIEILSGLYFSAIVNVGNIGNSFHELTANIGDNKLKDQYWGYNAGVKYSSIMGPVQLLVSNNNKDHETRFHLSIGFPF